MPERGYVIVYGSTFVLNSQKIAKSTAIYVDTTVKYS